MNFRKLVEASHSNAQLHSESPDIDLFEEKKILKKIDVSSIIPSPHQTRLHIDQTGIESLANSIKRDGLLQPITVRKIEKGYELISGERRWRATKLLSETTIDCIILNVDSLKSSQLAITENKDREGISDYELGRAYKSRVGSYKNIEELAKVFGETRTNIYKYWSFFKLPENCQEILDKNPSILSRRHCTEIIAKTNKLKDNNLCPGVNIDTLLFEKMLLIDSNKMTVNDLIKLLDDMLDVGSLEKNVPNKPFTQKSPKNIKFISLGENKIGSIVYSDKETRFVLSKNDATKELEDKIINVIENWINQN